MSKWLILGILILSPVCLVFGQTTLAIDSGYTYREVIESICSDPQHMCHYQPTVAHDNPRFREFTLRRIDNNGNVQEFMNFRALFPVGFNKNADVKYPMIMMLHGAGESGRSWEGRFDYTPEDIRYDNNSQNINHGGNAHDQAVLRNPTLSNSFPGIVVFPQNNHSGSWETGWNNGALTQNNNNAAAIVEYLIANYDADPDRVALHGLSNGAKGVWDLASKRSDLFAGILPFSGVARDYEIQSDILLTTPIWQFQGGLDANPAPGSAKQFIDLLITKGGNPKYTLYPNLGHGTWNTAIAEADFFPWIKSQHKKKVYVFVGVPELCEGGFVNLGYSHGFLAYQWTKNGEDIPGATDRYYSAT
jgi:predicted esterase